MISLNLKNKIVVVTGGTQGVGRATTQAMVVSSISIIVLTYFIGSFFINLR